MCKFVQKLGLTALIRILRFSFLYVTVKRGL